MRNSSPPTTQENDKKEKRDIRSFVIRSGRMTESQRTALDKHLKQWSPSPDPNDGQYKFEEIYGDSQPICMEIGFGMGDSLHQMAMANPGINFFGVEVHTPGVGRLLRLVEENELSNVRVVADDAVKILKDNIPAHSLDRVNIFFPDPWHKTKHRKRRLIQDDFLTLLHSRIKTNGILHIATDWVPYADHVITCVERNRQFVAREPQGPYVAAEDYGRPETKFERRGKRLEHEIRDIVLTPRPTE